MNCAQCQAANSPDAGFCGNCGARLAPASTAAGASGYPQSSGAPSGDSGPSGYGNSGEPTVLGTPAFHAPPPGAGAPSGYGAPSGSGAPSGYGAPSGSGQPGYGPPAGSGGPSGYGGPGYGPDGYGPPPPAAGYGPPPGANYGAPGGQAPNGQAPGGYQRGQYQPGLSGGRWSSLPPVSFSLARLTTVDKIIGVATLITMISLWLPWYTVKYSVLGVTSSGSVSGTHDHGWLWLEFLLALALIVYIAARAAWDQLPFQLPVAHEIVLIAATGLQFLLILIAFLAKPSVHGDPGYSIGWGFGAILGLLAAIAAAAPVAYPAVRAYLDRRKSGSGSAGAPRGY